MKNFTPDQNSKILLKPPFRDLQIVTFTVNIYVLLMAGIS